MTKVPPPAAPPDRIGFGNRIARVTFRAGLSLTENAMVAIERCWAAAMPPARLSAALTEIVWAPGDRFGSVNDAVPA